MKVKDIVVGGKYVALENGIARADILNGEIGRVVTVIGVGSYVTVPGECGRQDVIPAPERSDVRVWVQFDQERTVGAKSETITQNRLILPGSVLLTEREWKAKNGAYLKEQRRIVRARKAHERRLDELTAAVAKNLGVGRHNRRTARDRRLHVQGWETGTRYVYDAPNGEKHVPTVELSVDQFVRLVGKNGHRKGCDALLELIALEAKSDEEITC